MATYIFLIISCKTQISISHNFENDIYLLKLVKCSGSKGLQLPFINQNGGNCNLQYLYQSI
ncbi:hypothetical protein Avbf_15572 [Armadillidium vulgare]|nr:hypothetical protein Avbf_15572 [Armadillidium vulgare]